MNFSIGDWQDNLNSVGRNPLILSKPFYLRLNVNKVVF